MRLIIRPVILIIAAIIMQVFLCSCREIIQPTDSPDPTPGPTDACTLWSQAVSAAAFPGRVQHGSVVYGGSMWVIAGSIANGVYANDAWSSTDGVSWAAATRNAAFSARYGLAVLAYTNQTQGPNPGVEKMWLIAGENSIYRSETWYSTDGSIWTLATNTAAFGNRTEPSAVVFDGAMWVIAGIKTGNVPQNDVYKSTDGVNWSLVTADAGFPDRKQHTSVVYDGKIWVIGGNTNSVILADAWYSSDGISWYAATRNAQFGQRHFHTSVVFDNKMWVIGGYSGTAKNDCWYSENGVTWTQAAASAAFSERVAHTSAVYDNKIWVIAGGDATFLNSVWWSQ